jgi:hypothetical protein
MRDHKDLNKRFLAGLLSLLFFASCATFNMSPGGQGLEVTVKDVYEGVQDGNVESVPLPKDNLYVTVELCVENPSSTDRPIAWEDVYLVTKSNVQVFPSAVGYNQAEAFSWLLPLAEPAGAKRIVPLFYFFLIQNDEIMNVPAAQSVGCRGSFQFTSMALLFLVPTAIAESSYTLHFAGEQVPVTTDKFSPIWYVVCTVGVGFFFLLSIILGIVAIRRRSKARLP